MYYLILFEAKYCKLVDMHILKACNGNLVTGPHGCGGGLCHCLVPPCIHHYIIVCYIVEATIAHHVVFCDLCILGIIGLW